MNKKKILIWFVISAGILSLTVLLWKVSSAFSNIGSKNAESEAAGDSVTSSTNVVMSSADVNEENNKTASSQDIYKAPEQSQDELYQDIINTLLTPCIQKAINNYYEKYLTVSPVFSPYNAEVLDIERPMGYRTFSFLIKLQVKPYVGPHVNVGSDQLTINVDSGGEKVTVEKFEHLESYFDQLPPNLKNIIKK